MRFFINLCSGYRLNFYNYFLQIMKFTTLIATLAFSHLALADLSIPNQLTAQQLVHQIQNLVQARIEQNIKDPQIQIQITGQTVQQLPPLGPFMPQFRVDGNQVQMKNVFDSNVNEQIKKFQKEMEKRVLQHRQKMEQKMRKTFGKQQTLIGGGQHDKWNLRKEHPIVGNHDEVEWMKYTEEQPILGSHQEIKSTEQENVRPMVGNHDETQWMKQSNYRVDNREWKHEKKEWKHEKKQWKHEKKGRKHDNWTQAKHRQVNGEQLMPYLVKTFPALQGGNVIAVINKGFDKGFNLDIIYQDKDGKQFNIEAKYRPKREQLLVIKMEQTPLLLGRNQQSEKQVFKERLQMVPQFNQRQSHHKTQKEYMVPPHFLEQKHSQEQAKKEMMIPAQLIEQPVLVEDDIMIPAVQIQLTKNEKDEIEVVRQHPILGGQGEPQMINIDQPLLGKDESAQKQVMESRQIEQDLDQDLDQDIQNLVEDLLSLKKK